MEDNVFELITQALTENRIIDKLQKSEEYQKAKEEEHKAYDLLMSDLTGEQKQRLDELIGTITWSATVWEKMSYQQGMKDLFEFITSLL